MKERTIEFLKFIVCLCLFLFIGNIASLLMKIIGININEFKDKDKVIYQFTMSLIMFIVLFTIYFKKIQNDYADIKKDLGKNIKKTIKLFLIFMIVKYIVSFISILIITLLGYDTTSMTSVNQSMIEGLIKASPVLMLVSTAFLAPFYEEFLFRLGIGSVIKNKWLFIIISGTIFGLLHVFPLENGMNLIVGIIQSISYVTMGIFLSYVYKKNNNIFDSIGLHFLNNFLSALTLINMI